MKKFLFAFLITFASFYMVGCGSSKEDDIIEKLRKNIKDANSYHISGVFELRNNDDKYLYDIEVDYKKDNSFRVSLLNQTNNHEQIILKTGEDIYVITPALNKSFKFQSEWPYNNSQTYILQSILNDIEQDSEVGVKEEENGYIITTSVHYSNKKDLVSQNIYIDKDANILKVEVLDTSNQPKIIMNFNSINYNINIDDQLFSVEKNTSSEIETDITVGNLDGIVFPMYVPADTYLTSQDIISTDLGQRAILTFNGESPFTIIQETANFDKNSAYINVDGEPALIMDTVGVVSDTYISWISNGVEYYVVSEDLSQEELLTVANSISVMPMSK